MPARRRTPAALAVLALVALPLTACGGDGGADAPAATDAAAAAPAASTLAADAFPATRAHLASQTAALLAFTKEFRADADAYAALAASTDGDLARLWQEQPDAARDVVTSMREAWVAGNPLYERMEGIVAGVPSLATYDVILDAGTSAAEDPESAVPFDLELPDGTVLKQPGALYNVTEGALWGTIEQGLPASTPVDLDGDGAQEFGEVLPDPGLMVSATAAFERYATELSEAAAAWQPSASDALTALVVMVPTMSEYFGQWKESRFVQGETATGANFNVVSRLSDVHDIVSGLAIVFDDVQPLIAAKDPALAAQTGQGLDGLSAFVEDLRTREDGGARFTPEQAELLGADAQDQGTAVAGQVSQAATILGIPLQEG